MFTSEQLKHLSTIHFINNVDSKLKIITMVRIVAGDEETAHRILLLTELYYEGDRINELSFDLHNFGYEDILDIAKNIKQNDYIMQEIDTFLCGDIE
jgi:hypothetical protein